MKSASIVMYYFLFSCIEPFVYFVKEILFLIFYSSLFSE